MKRFTRWISLLCALCLLCAFPAAVTAEESSPAGSAEALPGTDAAALTEGGPDAMAAEAADESAGNPDLRTFRIALFSEPQSVTLPRSVTSYWFLIPEGTEISGASLSLILIPSETALEDYSTATLEINGISIASVSLQELRAERDCLWTVEIPVDRLKKDGTLNQLDIITAQRSILGECADIDNPSNWLVIGEDSALELTIRHGVGCTLGNLYPWLFNRVELNNRLQVGFEAAGGSDEELSSAMTLAAAFGAAYPYKDIQVLPVVVRKNDSRGDNHIRILADAASDSSLPALNGGEGYLAVSQENEITVTAAGKDSAGLKKAVRVLADPVLLSQFSGTDAVISTDLPRRHDSLPAREDGMYTLADFGYSDVSLAGAFHQQTSFTVHMPEDIIGGTSSWFEVHFRHSDALVSDTSLLTVLFDGTPAGSIQLSRMNVENGSLRVAIPREVMDKGRFDITVDVYNYLGKIDCSKDWYDVAWTVIDSDSRLYFEPGDNAVTPSLARFPSMNGSRVVICLPEGSSETVLSAMAALAARNGQNTQTAADYTLVHTRSAVNADNADNADLVIAGSVSSVVLPDAVAGRLYAVPGKDGYQVREGVNTLPEALKDKIVLQAVRSPYQASRIVYVITWPDEEGAEEKLLALATDRDQLNAFSGQLALSGAASSVSIRAEEQAETNLPFSVDRLITKTVRATGISRIGLLIIAILVLLVLILIIRQIRVRNQFKKAKENMERLNGEDAAEEGKEDASEEESDGGNNPDDYGKEEN